MEIDSRRPTLQASNGKHYIVEHNKKLKCVCQICTCGKHQCPRPRIKGVFNTSYQDHYQNYTLQPAPSLRNDYQYEQRHYNPQAMHSSYQNAYLPPQLHYPNDSPLKLQNQGNKMMNPIPFVGQTSYKDEYKPYTIIPQQQKNNDYQHQPIKFQGTSSYKAHYTEPPKLQRIKTPAQQLHPRGQIPFSGTSSYKNDFPKYTIQPQLQNQELAYRAPQVRFQGSTTYNDQYKGYQMVNPQDQSNYLKCPCTTEKLNIPAVNYINDQHHIYYDEQSKKFV